MSRSWGHVKLSRKLFSGEDPFWEEDRQFSRAEAWIDLIQDASWRDRTAIISGQPIQIERGQLVGSRRYLADRWNWSTWKVGKYLDLLEEMGRIRADTEHENNHLGAVITIVNYDKYQATPSDHQPDDQPPTKHPPTGDQPPTKQREVNEDNEAGEAMKGNADSDESELRSLADLGSEPPEDEVTRKQVTDALVAAWLSLQPERPPEKQIGKQGAVAKRLAKDTAPRKLAIALYGMEQLWEHREAGNPWDLFDFEKKLSKALKRGVEAMRDGGGSKADRDLSRSVRKARQAVGVGT